MWMLTTSKGAVYVVFEKTFESAVKLLAKRVPKIVIAYGTPVDGLV